MRAISRRRARAAPAADQPRGTSSFQSVGRFIVSLGQRRRLGMFIVFSLIGALAEAVVLLLIVAGASGVVSQTDVDLSVGPITSTWELHTVLLTALAGTLLLVASRLIAGALSSRLAATVLDQVRRRLLADLLRASWARQATVTAARLQDLVSVQSMRIAGIVAQLSNFATALISFLALIGTAFLVDATTAGALAAVGVALAFAFRPFTQRLQAASFAHLDEAHRYIAFVADLGGVLPELRVYGVRQRAEALHGDASARVADAYRRMRLAAMIQPATYIGVVLLLLTGGLYLLSLRTEVDVTLAGAIVLVLLRGLRYSQTAQSAWQKAVELVPYLDDFSRVREDWYTDAGRRGERALEHVGAISLESVGYTYPSGDVGVRDIDLRIEPGQVVGLAGPSGAGKTTLAHIILGLRQPSSGTLRIDGVPSTEFDEASWFSRFAYVAQQPVLLNRDVRENVRFLRDQITDERITSSLSEAAMDRDLLEWIAGDQRLVGVGGSEVSGGQRQRIAIARALVDDPDVLVLDEPTSALDSDAERVVRNSLERLRGKLTVVLIAHRESTLEVCDVVVTLDEGRISSVTSQDGTRGNAGASAD